MIRISKYLLSRPHAMHQIINSPFSHMIVTKQQKIKQGNITVKSKSTRLYKQRPQSLIEDDMLFGNFPVY